MKKILYILTQSDFGGAQRYVSTLARHIPKHTHEVHVAAGGNGILFEKLKSDQILSYKIKHLTRSINPFSDYLAYKELRKLIQKIQPDIVHLNSSKVGVIGSYAAKHERVKKIVYTAHGFVFNEPIFHALQWLYKLAEKSNAKRVDHIITVSENDKKTGIKAGIQKSKMTTIHNAIQKNEYNFLSKKQAQHELLLRIKKNRLDIPIIKTHKIIGVIANMYQSKGLDVLLKAIQTIPRVILIVIGDGPERSKLNKTIASLDITHKVYLLGNIEHASQFLKAFDVCALASRKEGLPYVLLEAAAAHVPIVATRVGGIPEMITHGMNGYLVPANDPPQLAKMIQRALQKPRNPILHGFDFKTMLNKTIKIYES